MALALPLLIFLAITIIGIPLIFVEILLLAVAGILGYTALTQIIGTKIADSAGSQVVNPLGAIALGALILGVLNMIPFFGGLLSLVLFVFAVGAALVTRFGTLQTQPGLIRLQHPKRNLPKPEKSPGGRNRTWRIDARSCTLTL